MKRFLLILLVLLLLLTGCGNEDIEPSESQTDPTEVTEATEPPIPWVEETGMEWDAEGVLKEIPLTIPDGMHYAGSKEFDGDLLIWSIDDHLEQSTLELCLVELDDGTISVQRDIPAGVYPQVMGDTLYLCDGSGGKIIALNKKLETKQQWEIDQTEDNLIMGGNGKLYRYTAQERLLCQDLATGEITPALEGDPGMGWYNLEDGILVIRCYLPETGTPDFAMLDLYTGTYTYAGAGRDVDSATNVGDTWLYEDYGERYVYDLKIGDAEPMRISPENGYLQLMDEGYLLNTSMDSTVLSLHALDGSLISSCRLAWRECGYVDSTLIWNESLGGYFVIFRSYDSCGRLLFWDVSKSAEGTDLALEPVPKPEELQLKLEQRAAELGKKYGVNILVGQQCDTQYDEFSATLATDYEQVNEALNVLDDALADYPTGFLRQLRYGSIYAINFQLIRDLQADGSGRTGGGYSAFTQHLWDNTLVVIDVEEASEQTYYHEVSHMIDRYLEWNAEQRTGALYSDVGWIDLNPGWFDGYTYDYGWEQTIVSDGAFIDGYATISPTEDRARVLEYAMVSWGEYNFRSGTVLAEKLEYYARCIRDAFNTDGWTGTPLWEQYL